MAEGKRDTWATLVAVLQDIGLVKLAKDIAAVKMTLSPIIIMTMSIGTHVVLLVPF